MLLNLILSYSGNFIPAHDVSNNRVYIYTICTTICTTGHQTPGLRFVVLIPCLKTREPPE